MLQYVYVENMPYLTRERNKSMNLCELTNATKAPDNENVLKQSDTEYRRKRINSTRIVEG